MVREYNRLKYAPRVLLNEGDDESKRYTAHQYLLREMQKLSDSSPESKDKYAERKYRGFAVTPGKGEEPIFEWISGALNSPIGERKRSAKMESEDQLQVKILISALDESLQKTVEEELKKEAAIKEKSAAALLQKPIDAILTKGFSTLCSTPFTPSKSNPFVLESKIQLTSTFGGGYIMHHTTGDKPGNITPKALEALEECVGKNIIKTIVTPIKGRSTFHQHAIEILDPKLENIKKIIEAFNKMANQTTPLHRAKEWTPDIDSRIKTELKKVMADFDITSPQAIASSVESDASHEASESKFKR